MFVKAQIGEYDADCLVDTGATLTLISSKVWSAIRGSAVPNKFEQDVISAFGNLLDIKGKTNVCFQINGDIGAKDVVIAEMDVDAILGLDFLLEHHVEVNIVEMMMRINGKLCPLIKIGKIGCYRVVVSERVPIPSRSEVILEGKLVDWNRNDQSIGVIESLGRISELK